MLMILSLSIACSSGSAPSGAQTPASPTTQASESGAIPPVATTTATPVVSPGENSGESKPAGQAASISPAATPISPEDRVPRISVDEARRLLAANQAVMVDVRAQDIYDREHIKGAINVPLAQLEAGDYKALPHHKRIITYCA